MLIRLLEGIRPLAPCSAEEYAAVLSGEDNVSFLHRPSVHGLWLK